MIMAGQNSYSEATFAETESETLKQRSVEKRGLACCLTLSPKAFQSKVLGMCWMMYSPGISPSSRKYMESPSFENDSIPVNTNQKIKTQRNQNNFHASFHELPVP